MRHAFVIARMVWLESIRRKDAYVLGLLLLGLTVWMASADIFGMSGASRYVVDLGLLAAWIFSLLFAITLTARQLPAEESRSTLWALLAKPVSRAALIAGKWMGCWAASVASTALLYIVVLVSVSMRGALWPDSGALAQALLLHAVALSMVCALALMLSTRMTFGAAATLTGLYAAASLLLLPSAPSAAAISSEARGVALLTIYHGLPQLGLMDLRARVAHDWGAAPWDAAVVAVFYGLAWTVLLLWLGWIAYRGRSFHRSNRI